MPRALHNPSSWGTMLDVNAELQQQIEKKKLSTKKDVEDFANKNFPSATKFTWRKKEYTKVNGKFVLDKPAQSIIRIANNDLPKVKPVALPVTDRRKRRESVELHGNNCSSLPHPNDFTNSIDSFAEYVLPENVNFCTVFASGPTQEFSSVAHRFMLLDLMYKICVPDVVQMKVHESRVVVRNIDITAPRETFTRGVKYAGCMRNHNHRIFYVAQLHSMDSGVVKVVDPNGIEGTTKNTGNWKRVNTQPLNSREIHQTSSSHTYLTEKFQAADKNNKVVRIASTPESWGAGIWIRYKDENGKSHIFVLLGSLKEQIQNYFGNTYSVFVEKTNNINLGDRRMKDYLNALNLSGLEINFAGAYCATISTTHYLDFFCTHRFDTDISEEHSERLSADFNFQKRPFLSLLTSRSLAYMYVKYLCNTVILETLNKEEKAYIVSLQKLLSESSLVTIRVTLSGSNMLCTKIKNGREVASISV